MRKILWIIFVIAPLSLQAKMQSEECLYSDIKSPDIRKGEVKIMYQCSDFPTPTTGVTKNLISFYDSKDALKMRGLILRTRVNKDSDEKDITLKFRHINPDQKIELNNDIYKSLKGSSEADLKCEADVIYGSNGNTVMKSCSLTTDTDSISEYHQMFAEMATQSKIQASLIDYQAVRIDAVSWKKMDPSFPKGISIEKWELKNKKNESLCLLEVSAKFEVSEDPKIDLPERLKVGADEAMAKLVASFPHKTPNLLQGNKTGKAIEFASAL